MSDSFKKICILLIGIGLGMTIGILIDKDNKPACSVTIIEKHSLNRIIDKMDVRWITIYEICL